MVPALRKLLHEVRTSDARSLALQLALEEASGKDLGRLVRTLGTDATMLLINGYSGQTLRVPTVDEMSLTIEAAAAAVELRNKADVTVSRRYRPEVMELARSLQAKLAVIEQARADLVRRIEAFS